MSWVRSQPFISKNVVYFSYILILCSVKSEPVESVLRPIVKTFLGVPIQIGLNAYPF
jgi:hypothetical protein